MKQTIVFCLLMACSFESPFLCDCKAEQPADKHGSVSQSVSKEWDAQALQIYEQSRTAFFAKKYDLALALIDKSITHQSNNPNSIYMRGLILAEQKREAESVAETEKALAISPERIDIWRTKTILLVRLGRQEQALDEICAARALSNVVRGELLQLIGSELMLENKWQAAATVQRRAILVIPDNLQLLRDFGTTLMLLRRFKESHQIFDRILSLAPSNYDVLMMRAQVRFDDGDKAGAKEDLLKVLRNRPTTAREMSSLPCVTVLYNQDTAPELNRFVDEARLRSNRVALAGLLSIRAQSLYSRGDWKGCVRDFQELRNCAAKVNEIAFLQASTAYSKLGDRKKTSECAEAWLREFPQSPNALRNKLWLKTSSGHKLYALPELNELLKSAPSAALFEQRASIFVTLKQYDRALSDYAQAVKLDPSRRMQLALPQAKLFNKIGDHHRAIKEITEVLRQGNATSDYYYERADAYASLGMKKEEDADRAMGDRLIEQEFNVRK